MALPTKLMPPRAWRSLVRARLHARTRALSLPTLARFLAGLIKADLARMQHRPDPAVPMLGDARGPRPVTVLALGGFELQVDGRAWTADGRTPRKPLALLKLLVIAGERGIDEDRLIEALWPDPLDGPEQKAFDVTLHRLRRLLRHDGAVRVRQRRVALEASVVSVDAWELEHALAASDDAWHGLLPDRAALETVLEAVRAHWRGPLLPDDRHLDGLQAARQRLQARVERWALALGDQREADGDLDGAAQLYRRLLDVEPLHPCYRRRLAAALQAAGRYDEAQAVQPCRLGLASG